jgi:hypothetical protein
MADKSIFTRLKRLFSTDVIIRNQGGNNVRVIDVNHIQTTGEIETNSLQDRFNRIYSSTNPSSLYGAQFNLNYQYLRTQMYSEYDVMDTDAIIASALDIIADESTLKNEQGEVLQIVSSDEDVQKILYNLFYDVLNIEFNMWSWVRQMCKYGDFFLKLEIADKFGVYNIIPYTAYHIERQEGYDKANPASIRYAFSPDGFAGGSYGYYNLPNQPTNSNRIYFDNYEMAHFRLLSDVNYLPYGRCLHPKSKIYTVNSIKEIKDIVKGDKVWTFNIEENKYELANVLNTINNGIKKLYKVSTQNNEILATSNHPILMWNFEQNKPDYKQVKDIKVGDYVYVYNEKSLHPKLDKIISIIEDLPEETYDIQVDVNSNFISDGIIVHNSYIEPARKLYKQYSLMEDSMLIHRIVRAPEKRVFYINIGGIPPNEVETFMQKTISAMKRTPYIDPETGEYNLKYNMQNMMEDFYIPVRGNDATTKIDTSKGLEYDGIKDVEYLRDKMFAALKVPKAFMGYEKDLTGKATLAAEDIRFARTIDRIQRIILSELEKIALIHLYTQGYDGEQLTNFKLSLTTPSIIYDQERLSLLKEKVDLAVTIFENDVLPSDWVYTNVFHLSESEFSEMRDLNVEDAKRRFRLKQISEEGNDPLETGKSYGTPHDLATLYGTGRYDNTSDVPAGYNEKATLGRPEEKASDINTQGNAFGRDRLGVAAMKKDDQPSFGKTNYKGGSPLALEGSKKSYFQNKKLLENMKVERKVIIFESDKNKESLLDDSQLRD